MADKPNVLTNIVNHKRDELALRRQLFPLHDLKSAVSHSERSFYQALARPGNRFILEYKRASPSRGAIRPGFSASDCIEAYAASADCLSVLTDRHYFDGSHVLLKSVTEKTRKPVLCKDFFIDEYQVYEARFYGADAILLMLSVLNDDDYIRLASVAESLCLDVLTEVHTEEECRRAVKLGAKMIGINNRDLRTLTTDLSVTEKLRPLVPSDRLLISESGIQNRNDVNRLAKQCDAFLIGSSLMSQPSVQQAANALVFGRIKICGVTTAPVAKQCFDQGATTVGLMFYPKSKRYIDPKVATELTTRVPGKYAGVFVNASKESIKRITEDCQLDIVQLHGDEDIEFAAITKQKLNSHHEVWKALPLSDVQDIERIQRWLTVADKVIVDYQSDNEKGGTGQKFDWSLLSELFATVPKNKIVIAGGINASNVHALSQYTEAMIDLSSGVERLPGEKDTKLLTQFFEACRQNGKALTCE